MPQQSYEHAVPELFPSARSHPVKLWGGDRDFECKIG